MVIKTLKGIYHNGRIQLEDVVNSTEPMDVVVIFINEESNINLKSDNFSFAKSLEITKGSNGLPLSEIVLQQRTEE